MCGQSRKFLVVDGKTCSMKNKSNNVFIDSNHKVKFLHRFVTNTGDWDNNNIQNISHSRQRDVSVTDISFHKYILKK